MRRLLIFTSILCALAVLCGCATKTKVEYVDREVVKYQIKYVHDTLRENTHDSIHHEIMVVNDTVYNTKYVEKTKWRERIVEKHDTCWRDSIISVTKNATIEKRVTPKWCYICLVVCVIFIILIIRKVITWLQIR